MMRSLVLCVLVACSSTQNQPDGAAPDTGVMDNPDVGAMDATGDAADAPIDTAEEEAAAVDAGCGAGYPMGPYGTKVGDVIDNLFFAGIRDANMNGTFSDDMSTTFCLGQYRQNPQVKVLVIIGGAIWCGPCNMEEPPLVSLYQTYQQNGGHVAFFEAMLQNQNYGMPTVQNLINWGNKYKPTWDLVIDPMQTFLNYNPPMAFPLHIIVDAKTMQIKFEESGYDMPTLEGEVDSVLTGVPFDAGPG
jgi:thiol-disulfide isomerase/thioredoxin